MLETGYPVMTDRSAERGANIPRAAGCTRKKGSSTMGGRHVMRVV